MSKDPKLTAAIAFYGMIFQAQQKTQIDSCMYQRFIKVPAILSIALRYSLACAIPFVVIIKFGSQNIVILFIQIAVASMVGLIAGALCSNYFLSLAAGQRITDWLRTKFDSREEMSKWIKAIPPFEFEFAASLPDEAWEVDEENGGIKIVEGHEHHLNQFRIAK